jgi:hypothetical protein
MSNTLPGYHSSERLILRTRRRSRTYSIPSSSTTLVDCFTIPRTLLEQMQWSKPQNEGGWTASTQQELPNPRSRLLVCIITTLCKAVLVVELLPHLTLSHLIQMLGDLASIAHIPFQRLRRVLRASWAWAIKAVHTSGVDKMYPMVSTARSPCRSILASMLDPCPRLQPLHLPAISSRICKATHPSPAMIRMHTTTPPARRAATLNTPTLRDTARTISMGRLIWALQTLRQHLWLLTSKARFQAKAMSMSMAITTKTDTCTAMPAHMMPTAGSTPTHQHPPISLQS